jgi:tetratricopeptide (TPR) repeat protein
MNGARARRRCRVLRACALVLVVAPPDTHGEDRVTVQRAGATGSMTITGEVEDFTARRLTLRIQDGAVRRSFPTEDVVSIETHRSEPHRQGLEALAAGRFADAESLLAAAINKDVRRWVQQDLYADLVRCALRRGDRRAAGNWFVRMIAQEPSSRHWGTAPLVWSAEEINGELREAATGWLASSDDGVRLPGASILLLDVQHSNSAQRALDDLSRSPDLPLQSLAQAQLWRLRLAAGDVSASELQVWRQGVESMPATIRAGPMYLIGRASAARSDLEQAAADWLWLPLVYDDDAGLAARACVDAADALSRLGRRDEAAGLYREAIDRFGWSPAARDAQQRLDRLSSEGSADGV